MPFEGSQEKFGVFSELWAFMRVRKKWQLEPMLQMLALPGFLVVFTQGSAIAPFICTLFQAGRGGTRSPSRPDRR